MWFGMHETLVFILRNCINQMWWYMPVIPELRTEDQEEARGVRAGMLGREPHRNTACWFTYQYHHLHSLDLEP